MEEVQMISSDYLCMKNDKLGEGSFGIVYRGTKLSNKASVAIKTHKQSQNEQQMLREQAFVLDILQKNGTHPNIIRMLDKVVHKNKFYIILQYCQGGSLDALISKTSLSQQTVYQYLSQQIDALYFMNQRGIVHRDLKLQNILIKDNILKIADFGTARILQLDNIGGLMDTYVGTRMYMPPNIIQKLTYTSKCDIWSFGVMIYQLLTGKHMYQKVLEYNENQKREQYYELLKCEKEMEEKGRQVLDGDYSEFFKKFVEMTIVVKEAERCSIEKLHEWVKRYKGDKMLKKESNKLPSIEKPNNTIKKRTFKITEYKVIREQSGQYGSQSETNPQSFILMNNFCKYILYLYERANAFVQIARHSKLQNADEESKYIKFITEAIALIIYNTTLNNTIIMLNEQKCQLPNKTVFDGKKLSSKIRKQFELIKQEYLKNTRKALKNQQLISTRFNKMSSVKICQQVLMKQEDEIIEIEDTIRKYIFEKQSNVEFRGNTRKFQQIFTLFIQRYYIPRIDLLNDNQLRVYTGFLTLANLETQFPLKQFENDLPALRSLFKDIENKNNKEIMLQISRLRGKLGI